LVFSAGQHTHKPPDGDALDPCADVALGRGTLVRLDAKPIPRAEDGDAPQAGETNRDESMISIDSAQLFSALRKIVVALHGDDL
jgi:hypothetical protein